MAEVALDEREYLACCGSAKFAKEMAEATPFASYDLAVQAARDIWFNKVRWRRLYLRLMNVLIFGC